MAAAGTEDADAGKPDIPAIPARRIKDEDEGGRFDWRRKEREGALTAPRTGDDHVANNTVTLILTLILTLTLMGGVTNPNPNPNGAEWTVLWARSRCLGLCGLPKR